MDICEKCNKGFRDKYKLQQHYKKKIPCDYKIQCNNCGKHFNTKQNLNRHINKQKKCVKYNKKCIETINQLKPPNTYFNKLKFDNTNITELSKTIFTNKVIIIGPNYVKTLEEILEICNQLKIIKNDLNNEVQFLIKLNFTTPNDIQWKGIIYDPDNNKKFDIEKGIYNIRKLMLEINKLDILIALEMSDSLLLPYFSDLIVLNINDNIELASSINVNILCENNLSDKVKSPNFLLGINDHGSLSYIKSTGNINIFNYNDISKCNLNNFQEIYKKNNKVIMDIDLNNLKDFKKILYEL